MIDEAFNELQDELRLLISDAENVTGILEIGAKAFVADLLKLPKPISEINISGYTHLIDTFSYQIKDGEIEVCWGKYYGRMVEDGTKLTSKQPHMLPTFESNKNKYYKKMIEKL